MLAVVLIFICLACGILLWWRRNPNKDEPPAYSGSLPLIGHAHHIVGDSIKLWNLLKDLSHESLKAGGAISISIGPKVLYVVTNPDDYLKIANTCLQKENLYEFSKPWVGNGLSTSDVPVWKTHRKLLKPAFSPVVLYGFLDVFNGHSRLLVKDLEVEVGRGPFDHWVYTRNNVLETLCLAVLGVDIRDQHELYVKYANATADIVNIFIDRFQKFWFHSNFIYKWSALKRKQDACVKILHDMSYFVLKQRKADYLNSTKKEIEMTTKGPIFRPFLDLLLELAKVEKGAFNDQEIREHLDTMIFGGHDTTASVLMYNMLLVGSHPHVQEKIFEELFKVFGDADRDVTKQDLSQLIYLEAVIKETMRFYPVAPTIARCIDRDIKLQNWTLSKGRTCFLSIYGVHRHPMWGPDAELFNPERWLDPATLPDSTNVFAGFSLGKRNCFGQAYAIMAIKVTLAHLYRHYRLSGDHTKLVAKIEVLLKPVSGHHVTIEKRNK